MKRLFYFIFLLLSVPIVSEATLCNGVENGLNLCYPRFGGFSITSGSDILQIIAWAYALIVGISGFAAFVMLVWGGIQWLGSSVNPTAAADAKDRIKNALLGLLLVLASFLILQIINPDLRIISLPSLH